MLMPLTVLLVIIFLASLILTMVGLWGGVDLPSPLFFLFIWQPLFSFHFSGIEETFNNPK